MDNVLITSQISEFVSTFNTAVIASLSKDNVPNASVIPVVKYQHKFYTYISVIADHYDNFKHNKQAQMIFAQDEADTDNYFFRKRVIFNVVAKFIDDDEEIFDMLKQRYGSIIDMLRTLDFSLLELDITDGKAIFGAGQAYYVDDQEIVTGQDTGKNGYGHGENSN